MSVEPRAASPEFLARIQPIVLVGGRSRRFGRDKLREPWGNEGHALVSFPIEALRAVFGRRVRLVGMCDTEVLPYADGVIPDLYPGIGPIGGIASALSNTAGPVFVLAGDMPGFRPADIAELLIAAEQHPGAHAVWAWTDRPHPCAGVYSQHALPALEECISSGAYALVRALQPSVVLGVLVSAEAARNVNLPEDARN